MLKQYFDRNNLSEAGCDEAGRGCLAGPVFAAAVILPKDYKNPRLNDSKQLSHKQRMVLKEEIEKSATAWCVQWVSPQEIDRINILNASILAMHKAIEGLNPAPTFLIIDGNRFKPFMDIQHQCIVKGDSKYLSIAAASIIAKTYRDLFMENLSKEFPSYGWAVNKGYPTKKHRQAIEKFGITEHHRISFKLGNRQSGVKQYELNIS